MLTNGSLIFVNGAPAIFHRYKPGGRADVILNGLLREVDITQITQEQKALLPNGSGSVIAVLVGVLCGAGGMGVLWLLWEGLSR